MISDADLYQLAIFLGSSAMLLIILYHFLEVNGDESTVSNLDQKSSAAESSSRSGKQDTATVTGAGAGGTTTSAGGSRKS